MIPIHFLNLQVPIKLHRSSRHSVSTFVNIISIFYRQCILISRENVHSITDFRYPDDNSRKRIKKHAIYTLQWPQFILTTEFSRTVEFLGQPSWLHIAHGWRLSSIFQEMVLEISFDQSNTSPLIALGDEVLPCLGRRGVDGEKGENGVFSKDPMRGFALLMLCSIMSSSIQQAQRKNNHFSLGGNEE